MCEKAAGWKETPANQRDLGIRLLSSQSIVVAGFGRAGWPLSPFFHYGGASWWYPGSKLLKLSVFMKNIIRH